MRRQSVIASKINSRANPRKAPSRTLMKNLPLKPYANGSANTVRRTGMTYPSGKIIYYTYGFWVETNDRLSRVDLLTGNDEIDAFESYTYVGLNRIAQVYSTEANIKLTYIQLDSSNPRVGTGASDAETDLN